MAQGPRRKRQVSGRYRSPGRCDMRILIEFARSIVDRLRKSIQSAHKTRETSLSVVRCCVGGRAHIVFGQSQSGALLVPNDAGDPEPIVRANNLD